jgi:hypothetical protein
VGWTCATPFACHTWRCCREGDDAPFLCVQSVIYNAQCQNGLFRIRVCVHLMPFSPTKPCRCEQKERPCCWREYVWEWDTYPGTGTEQCQTQSRDSRIFFFFFLYEDMYLASLLRALSLVTWGERTLSLGHGTHGKVLSNASTFLINVSIDFCFVTVRWIILLFLSLTIKKL